MVLSSEIIATAAASFLLGWTLKNNFSLSILKRIRSNRLPFESVKLVVVVRTDLKMSKGKIASQCSHATLACYKQGLLVCPDVIKDWERLGQKKVILRTNLGEAGLRMIAKEAEKAELVTALIRDAGLTEIPSSTATVLGIGPDYASKIDKITSSLGVL